MWAAHQLPAPLPFPEASAPWGQASLPAAEPELSGVLWLTWCPGMWLGSSGSQKLNNGKAGSCRKRQKWGSGRAGSRWLCTRWAASDLSGRGGRAEAGKHAPPSRGAAPRRPRPRGPGPEAVLSFSVFHGHMGSVGRGALKPRFHRPGANVGGGKGARTEPRQVALGSALSGM